jgi:heme/copper-type cytochrome/quinol oxidase subunit 1
MLIGFALYFVPLQIGANEIAFPRFSALGYWVFLFGGLPLYYRFLGNGAPDAGWFSYTPLPSEFNVTADSGMNYWGVALLTTGIGIMSVHASGAAALHAGMTLRRLPLFTWMSFFTGILILLAMPSRRSLRHYLSLATVFCQIEGLIWPS